MKINNMYFKILSMHFKSSWWMLGISQDLETFMKCYLSNSIIIVLRLPSPEIISNGKIIKYILIAFSFHDLMDFLFVLNFHSVSQHKGR